MKKITLILLTILSTLSMYGQDITGQWNGALKVQGTQLRLVFNVTKTDNVVSSTMDSPDQGAKGIPTTTTSFENSILKITIANAKIEYEGTLRKDDIIVGTFKQGGQSFPMNLSKEIIEKEKLVRPQEPIKPYSYYSEDITFENKKAGVSLAGTLTLPKKDGVFPVVILISGSGPQNRDEELLGHKPFLVLSDFLTKNGIAVLRFDDRGTGKSSGDFKEATTFDFAKDVEYAIEYLQKRKEINKDKIGLIGHSEGGIIAPIIASENEDIDFIVLMAGSALRGDKLLLLQKYKIETQMGINRQLVESNQQIFAGAYEIILNESIENELVSDTLSKYFTSKYGQALPEKQKIALINQLSSPWMINFIRLDPAVYLSKVNCPVLAINGSKDIQVPSKENLEIIKDNFRKTENTSVKVKELEDLNHLFQECETGSISEYGTIEQTISPIALKEILNWINIHIK
ncbi:alpha/beta hydrolase family protein [Psychroflexus sp. MES1-P1E]|uniref:alpha/beta hydrolase family protein n=1 Tax=Psychroflexus sp. MES1-P1E TaxID=2058320 RepID=UPI000C7D826F|nr:alpha/beta hydrolase [Psychroflexus sp. MES1-P1E]PKG43646.1 alpha/beta hydrolase [Psychroflexus sp. MES1-P1E]